MFKGTLEAIYENIICVFLSAADIHDDLTIDNDNNGR